MARRTDLAAMTAEPASADQAGSGRTGLPWWRLRSWRKDVEILARVRNGIQQLPGHDEPGRPVSGSTAGPADTADAVAPAARQTASPPLPFGTKREPAPDAAGHSGSAPDRLPPWATDTQPRWLVAEPSWSLDAPAAGPPIPGPRNPAAISTAHPALPGTSAPAADPETADPEATAAAAADPEATAAAAADPEATDPEATAAAAADPEATEPQAARPDLDGPSPAGAAAQAADEGAEEPADTAAQPASPDQALLSIKKTFACVAEAGDAAAAFFYARLFVQSPGLRRLFPPAMDEQRDRLFHSLARIVESLSTPEELASYLTQLGRDHRKYAVEPVMYEEVGSALIATLRTFAGAEFTPAAAQAWGEAYTAASSLMINAAEEDKQTSPAYWTAEVVEHERIGYGIAVVTVAPDLPLPYEPGQHLTVQTSRWPHVWRPYSIACRPREDGLIRLHVKAIPGGWVSNALVHHTVPGDEVTLGPALGTMTLAAAGSRDLLCVAGGTGLAPIKAIAEQAIKDSAVAAPGRKIHLFYGARRREELYDLRDLWRLADAFPGFQLTPVTSDDPAFDGMQGNVGRVAARYMPHLDCEAFVAGPESMVRETIRVLARAGLERDRIHFDDALLAGHKRVGTGT